MNDFKGLARDMATVKTPEQMWQFARNILLTKKYTSITNEKGNEYGYSLPGVVIGFVVANEDIVYYSIDGDYTCIGYVNYINQVYTPVLRTTNDKFKFKKNCPIEGVYIYNYKKEMIVVFSDGVNNNSNTPKLINLHNPQVKLSSLHEFVVPTDYLMFELFSYVELAPVDITYELGSLDAEVVHMAYCYVYDDNTDSLYSPIVSTAYPNYKKDNTIHRNVKYKLTQLSSRYNKVKLAFIIKTDAGLFAYTTSILPINNNNTVEYTLATLGNLTIATAEEILIAPERYDKIKTLTKTANQIIIANVEKKREENIQKYVNKLKLKLKRIDNNEYEDYKTHPTFMPDEVYSFRFVPIYLKSSKGNAYHIPGKKTVTNENKLITDAELTALGLNFAKYKGKGYKEFHFINKGISNNTTTEFGYWENEDKYPFKDDYNSTSIGGEDLRGTPVRYHRIPAIDNILSSHKPKVKDTVDDSLGFMPRFKVEVDNLTTAFPSDILAELQGYEIIIEKRSKGGTYVESNGFLYKFIITPPFFYPRYADDPNYALNSQDTTESPCDFSISHFISPEVAKDKISINAQLVKIYQPITKEHPIFDTPATGDTHYDVTTNTSTPTMYNATEKIGSIKEAKYLLANNISSNNRFAEERLELKLEHLGPGDSDPAFIPIVPNTGAPDINFLFASLITLNRNIYELENSTDFISVGTVIFNKTNEPLVNGDVFLTNVIKKSHSTNFSVTEERGVKLTAYRFVEFYLYNMYTPFSNNYIINGAAKSKLVQNNSLNYPGYPDWTNDSINLLNSFNYSTIVKDSGVLKYFNDYIGAIPPSLNTNFINYFPYRVHKGLAIPNESLQSKNLRFFPTNSYYDMRNDRGEIIAVRGYNRGVYIQQRYSLFETTISDKLNATAEETYLGSSELFDRIPEEIMYNDNIGYIGSNSQFACMVTKDGYITIDEEKGRIFMVSQGMEEVSQQYLKNYFQDYLPLGTKYMKKDLLNKDVKVDNPFVSIGYMVGIDEENNRILVTKKYYEKKPSAPLEVFDGEFYKDALGKTVDYNDEAYFINKSLTFSYALDSKTWVCEHDYFPNAYLHNSRGFYAILNKLGTNAKQYKFNSDNVNPGNYFDKQFEAYVDLIHNTRLDINKQYQAIYWVTEAVDMATERILQFDTIDKVMLYTNHQCSGIIPVSKTNLGNARSVEGIWQLNEFRDMMKSPDYKIIDEDGKLINDGLLTQKQWFTKGLFIGNFIVTRFIWTNETKVLKHLHNVNVKSITSNR